MKQIEILNHTPKHIKKYIENQKYRIDTIGMESSQVFIYEDIKLVLKVNQVESDYIAELQMMRWLEGKVLVPHVMETGESHGNFYILMTLIEGLMSFDESLMSDPESLIDILVGGIKSFWNLPVEECPIDNRIEYKLKIAKRNIEKGLCSTSDWDPDIILNRFQTVEELYDYLLINQMEEELTLSHGDYCLPNILIKDNRISGFIDLSSAGVADIYQDISLFIRSFSFNINSKNYKKMIFEKLGIKVNEKKLDYYLLLDELF
ncbi:MAG: aminoglycoside 3'-phosphotransferase [Firmicutes bacterium]|nr:aminoglycoside 3'-phosphotransferase [Bacillota bacterium]